MFIPELQAIQELKEEFCAEDVQPALNPAVLAQEIGKIVKAELSRIGEPEFKLTPRPAEGTYRQLYQAPVAQNQFDEEALERFRIVDEFIQYSDAARRGETNRGPDVSGTAKPSGF